MNLFIKNKKEKSEWMNERTKKGYSFRYFKGEVFGEIMNVGVLCVETHEEFLFDWVEE